MENSMHLKRLILAGMLASMGTALKIFSLTTNDYSFRFHDIPLFFGGIVLGPLMGIVIGFAADVGFIAYSPFATSINLMTLSAMLWGFAGGYFYLTKKVGWISLTVVIVTTSLLAFTINSVWLYLERGPGAMWAMFPFRLVTMVIKWPIQIMVIRILYERVFLNSSYNLSYTTRR